VFVVGLKSKSCVGLLKTPPQVMVAVREFVALALMCTWVGESMLVM
jgi:hypothetical protein